jgi:hypothetical protein
MIMDANDVFHHTLILAIQEKNSQKRVTCGDISEGCNLERNRDEKLSQLFKIAASFG